MVKVVVHPTPAHSWEEVRAHLAAGLVPWWMPLAYLGLFFAAALVLLFATPRWSTRELEYWTPKRDF
jgi:hypothetical protein